MSEVRLRIEGPEAEAAAGLLAGIAREELAAEPAVRAEAAPVPRQGERGDPVAVAALILSIPGAALAAWDLGERIARTPRVRALIERWQAARPPGVTVHVLAPEGEVELQRITAELLIDSARS